MIDLTSQSSFLEICGIQAFDPNGMRGMMLAQFMCMLR